MPRKDFIFILLLLMIPLGWGFFFHLSFFFYSYYSFPFFWEIGYLLLWLFASEKVFDLCKKKRQGFLLGLASWFFFFFFFMWQYFWGSIPLFLSFSQLYPFGFLHLSIRILGLFPLRIIHGHWVMILSFLLHLFIFFAGFYYQRIMENFGKRKVVRKKEFFTHGEDHISK